MPVANQNVGPALIIHIEKTAAPAKILRMLSQPALVSCVLERTAAQISVKRRRVARKIGLHQIKIAVEIVIGRGNAHTRLPLAIRTQSASSFQRDVHERAILSILVEST